MPSPITNVPFDYEWPFTKEKESEIPVTLQRGRNTAETSYVGSGKRQNATHQSIFTVQLRSPQYGPRSALGTQRDPVKGFTVVLPQTHDHLIEPHRLEFTHDPENGSYYHDLPPRSVTGTGQEFGGDKMDRRVGVPLTVECKLQVKERLILDSQTADDCLKRDAAKLGSRTLSARATSFVPANTAPLGASVSPGSSPCPFRHGQRLTFNIPRGRLFGEHIPSPLMGNNCLLSRSGANFTALIHSGTTNRPITAPVSNRVTLIVTEDAINKPQNSRNHGGLLGLSEVNHLTVNYDYPYSCEPKPQGTVASTQLLYDEKLGRFNHSRTFGRCDADLLTPEGGSIRFTAELQVDWFFDPNNRGIASLHDQASRNEALRLDSKVIGSHYPEYQVAKDWSMS